MLCGCSLTAKRDAARAITAAQKKLVSSSTALLSVTVQLELPRGCEVKSGPHAGPVGPARSQRVVLNFAKQRALVIAAAGSAAQPGPVQYFDGGVIYQRLSNDAGSSHPWLALDYGRLYDKRKSQVSIGYGHDLLSPLWIVDLLKGALTGSIKQVGTAKVAGAAATEYTANFAWDKSLRNASDDHTRDVQAALTLLGIPNKVVKGRVWLDRSGGLRQMEAVIRQNNGRHQALDWRYTMQFAAIGQPVPIELPKTSEVARVDSFGQITGAQATVIPARAS
jgi:hypothetical protein